MLAVIDNYRRYASVHIVAIMFYEVVASEMAEDYTTAF